MTSTLIVGGVLFTGLIPQLVLAVAITVAISFFFVRLNLFRFMFHRPLIEVCILCIVLGVVVMLSPDGWPIWQLSTDHAQ